MLPVKETLSFEDLPEIPTASPWCQRWREREDIKVKVPVLRPYPK